MSYNVSVISSSGQLVLYGVDELLMSYLDFECEYERIQVAISGSAIDLEYRRTNHVGCFVQVRKGNQSDPIGWA